MRGNGGGPALLPANRRSWSLRAVTVVPTGGAPVAAVSFSQQSAGKQIAQTRFDREVPCRAFALTPFAQRHHRLRHMAMAAGAADIAEQAFDEVAGIAAADAVITHGDYQVPSKLCGYRDPLDTLELQAKIRDLHDQVVAFHCAEVQDDEAIPNFHTLHRARQDFRKPDWQLRPIDE